MDSKKIDHILKDSELPRGKGFPPNHELPAEARRMGIFWNHQCPRCGSRNVRLSDSPQRLGFFARLLGLKPPRPFHPLAGKEYWVCDDCGCYQDTGKCF